jgi:hypothetical protein
MKLLKNGRIGKMCKISALAIALIGAAQVTLQFYSTWTTYQQLQSQPGQFGPSQSVAYSNYLVPDFNSALQSVATIIFYVVVLYVAGVIINAFFGPTPDETATNNVDETIITYEPLDDEERIESIDRRR